MSVGGVFEGLGTRKVPPKVWDQMWVSKVLMIDQVGVRLRS